MKKMGVAITMTLLVSGTPLFAGEEPPASSPLRPGDRIRIQASTIPTPVVGQLVEAAPGALRIRLENRPEPIEVPVAALTTLERSLGRHGSAATGALVGGLAGVAFVAIGAKAGGGCEGPCGIWALLFGGAGAILGAGAGALVKAERWEALPVGRVSVGVLPQPRGAGVALSVRF